MSIKKIIVDPVSSYDIPIQLRDGSEKVLHLRPGFTMCADDADELMKFAMSVFKNMGKKLAESSEGLVPLTKEEINALNDQEKAAYVEKIDKATDGELFTESHANRKLIAKAYDVTEEWLVKNITPQNMSDITLYIMEWAGMQSPKKSR